jgi:hypothetical protein
MTRVFSLLLTLLFSLGDPAMRESSDFGCSLLAANTGASSALQGARLGEHLTQLEKYGAQGFKELESGSVRYYGNLKAAATPGEMSGARLVREWNPASGGKRTWMETLDQIGTARSVRPETGGPKVHYIFDANGNFTGTR